MFPKQSCCDTWNTHDILNIHLCKDSILFMDNHSCKHIWCRKFSIHLVGSPRYPQSFGKRFHDHLPSYVWEDLCGAPNWVSCFVLGVLLQFLMHTELLPKWIGPTCVFCILKLLSTVNTSRILHHSDQLSAPFFSRKNHLMKPLVESHQLQMSLYSPKKHTWTLKLIPLKRNSFIFHPPTFLGSNH